MEIPEKLKEISKTIKVLGGTPYLVGGSVRDYIIGKNDVVKDYDVEVFGIEMNRLQEILSRFSKVDLVGKSFGVLKFKSDGLEYDFSLPRTDNQNGHTHRSIKVSTDPYMSFEDATKRRDLTINSIGYNLISNMLVDPNGGINDIKDEVIRVVDRDTFMEDPLRMLRIMQFAARLEYRVDEETSNLVKANVDMLDFVASERIFDELKKLLLKSRKPSIGLEWALEVGIVDKLWPELALLKQTDQNPKWHQEGSVWAHTMLVIDEAAKLKTQENNDRNIVLMLTALLHDIGKPKCTEVIDGNITSRGHEAIGAYMAKKFLLRLTNETDLIAIIESLIKYHLQPMLLFRNDKVTNGSIRRLALKTYIHIYCLIAMADKLGRVSDDKNLDFIDWLLGRFDKLVLNDPIGIKPLINGKDLLEKGFTQGKNLGIVLGETFEKQLDDKFANKEEAMSWILDNFTLK